MNSETLFAAMTEIDKELLNRSEKKPVRILPYMAASAALLAIIIVCQTVGTSVPHSSEPTVPQPTPGSRPTLQASDYFRDCTIPDGTIVTEDLILNLKDGQELRDYTAQRSEWENGGLIPEMPGFNSYECTALYDGDNFLYARIVWIQDHLPEEYSHITLIVSQKGVSVPSDHTSYCIDENGSIIEPSITVTMRDDLPITGWIEASGEYHLAFETENASYQITGYGNETPDLLVFLLDELLESNSLIYSYLRGCYNE